MYIYIYWWLSLCVNSLPSQAATRWSNCSPNESNWPRSWKRPNLYKCIWFVLIYCDILYIYIVCDILYIVCLCVCVFVCLFVCLLFVCLFVWFVWDTDPRQIGLRDLLAGGLGCRRRSTDLTSQRSGRNSRIWSCRCLLFSLGTACSS